MFNLTYQPDGRISAMDNTIRPISIQEAVFEVNQLAARFLTESDDSVPKTEKLKKLVNDIIAKIKAFFKGLVIKIKKNATDREKFILENKGTIYKYVADNDSGNFKIPDKLMRPTTKLSTSAIMSAIYKILDSEEFTSDQVDALVEKSLKTLSPSYSGNVTSVKFFQHIYGTYTDVPKSTISPAQLVDSYLTDSKTIDDIDKWELAFTKNIDSQRSHFVTHDDGKTYSDIARGVSAMSAYAIKMSSILVSTLMHAEDTKYRVLVSMAKHHDN